MVQVIEDKRDENLHFMQQIHTILSGCFGRTKEAMPKLKRRRQQESSDIVARSPIDEMDSEKPLKSLPHLSSRSNSINHRSNKYEQMPDLGKRAQAALADACQHTSNTSYRIEREALLADEKARSWQARAITNATPTEKRAQRIVRKIREAERLDPSIYGEVPSEAVPDGSVRDMGGRFLVNKERADPSPGMDIALRAPKGAHLHEHLNSEIKPELLLPRARALPDNMYIRSTTPLDDPAKLTQAEIVFNVMPKDTPSADIFSADYNPAFRNATTNPWMRWSEFRERFPKDVHTEARPEGLDDAECWAREKMVITTSKAYHDRQTHNGAWACFNIGTRAFKGLVNYKSGYEWYIRAAIDNMITDRVMYAELRPMLLDKTIPTDDGLGQLNHYDQMKIIVDVVHQKQGELRAAGELDKFPFGVKIIYCTPRSIPKAMMQKELEDCIKLKLEFPDLICGFDLVGAEDRPNNIKFYSDQLLAFVATCKSLDISIPFMFHAGETLLDTGGSADPDNSNLYDSLLLNAKRIGHGYALLKHPLLIEKYKAAGIALELCPISNELLHLTGNIRQHPFPALLAAGLHCSLNADNPSLFRSTLSHEFYQVMVGDTRMTLHGWRQLVEWSIEHSCLDKWQQAQALDILKREWEEYCQWIVKKYGEFAESLPEPK